jgi:hypothetical protein
MDAALVLLERMGLTPADLTAVPQDRLLVPTHVVGRRNARGGRSAEEHLVAALRCLYKRAVTTG